MATIVTQNIITTGLTATYAAASGGGDRFQPGAGQVMHIKNGGGAPITATLVTPGLIDGDLAVANRDVVVANGADKFVALPDSLYRSADGLGDVTWSGVTSVTVAVLRSPLA